MFFFCLISAMRMLELISSTLREREMATEEATQEKQRLGFSLTTEAQRLLRELKKKTGLSQTSVVEVAIREKAEKEGVK